MQNLPVGGYVTKTSVYQDRSKRNNLEFPDTLVSNRSGLGLWIACAWLYKLLDKGYIRYRGSLVASLCAHHTRTGFRINYRLQSSQRNERGRFVDCESFGKANAAKLWVVGWASASSRVGAPHVGGVGPSQCLHLRWRLRLRQGLGAMHVTRRVAPSQAGCT
jgi:hypothetical protein